MTLQNRTLTDVIDELHAALRREAADIVMVGTLLAEAKERVPHGVWLPWLREHFSISDRSAQKYMKAADFAARNELGADLNLTPSALYLLSEDNYWGKGWGRREATEAVLKAAKDQRLNYRQVKQIVDKTVADLPATDGAEPAANLDTAASATGRPNRVSSRDELLFKFTAVVLELDRLTRSRQAERFAKTAVMADDLARVGNLLTDIADVRKSNAVSLTNTAANDTTSPDLPNDEPTAHAQIEAIDGGSARCRS